MLAAHMHQSDFSSSMELVDAETMAILDSNKQQLKPQTKKAKRGDRQQIPINQFPQTICLSHFTETPRRASVQSMKCSFQEPRVMEWMWNYVRARMKIMLATEITSISRFKDGSTSPKR